MMTHPALSKIDRPQTTFQSRRIKFNLFDAWHGERVRDFPAYPGETPIFFDAEQYMRGRAAIRDNDRPHCGSLFGPADILIKSSAG